MPWIEGVFQEVATGFLWGSLLIDYREISTTPSAAEEFAAELLPQNTTVSNRESSLACRCLATLAPSIVPPALCNTSRPGVRFSLYIFSSVNPFFPWEVP